jgi:hypothetical protein
VLLSSSSISLVFAPLQGAYELLQGGIHLDKSSLEQMPLPHVSAAAMPPSLGARSRGHGLGGDPSIPSAVVAMTGSGPARTAATASVRYRRQTCILAECTPPWRKKFSWARAASVMRSLRRPSRPVIDSARRLGAREPAPLRHPPLRRCGSQDAQGGGTHLSLPSRLAAPRRTWQGSGQKPLLAGGAADETHKMI